MGKYYSTFDSANKYFHPDDIYSQGNSPAILTALQQFLEDRKHLIAELFLCFGQFNNDNLHNYLKSLSDTGIKINLITTPINGFSSKKFILPKNLVTGQLVADSATTPYALARPILAKHYKGQVNNFQLHFFPHLNIRSAEGNPFEQIQEHFSLRLNVFMVVYKNGGGFTGFSTADLSVGTSVEDSYLLIVEEDWSLLKSARRFFEALIKNAIPVEYFDFQKKYNKLLLEVQEISQDRRSFFTAPFFKGSPGFAEKSLASLIQKAKEKILIAGPTIDAYEYEVDGRFHSEYSDEVEEHFGFLRPVIEKAAEGVDCKCLCNKRPTKAKAFLEMIDQIPRISLATSPKINFSFIIIDELLVLSSGDWSIAEFLYLDDIQIDQFEQAPKENYIGIFAPFTMYLCIEDKKILEKFSHFFESQWKISS